MFSPSLISMMIHSLGPDDRSPLGSPTMPLQADSPPAKQSLGDLVDLLSRAVSGRPVGWPAIPVAGRTSRSIDQILDKTAKAIQIREFGRGFYFWGRVPLNHLVDLFAYSYLQPADVEFVDLGTPVRAGGSGSIYDQQCSNLLNQTADPPGTAAGNPATVGAAIVDMGAASSKAPDNYGGKLRHVVTGGVELSKHAEQVLSVLLDRLNHNGVLKDTTVSCALVQPPVQHLNTGRSCFDQACTPEILTALQLLEPQLAADGIPVAVNMSLGTHVGPHNGSSPLEEYIASTFVTSDRYVVAAAGNEGGTGCAAKRLLVANEPEFLALHTGKLCKEVLAEFWWDDSTPKGVSIEAEIYELSPIGTMQRHGTLTIDPTTGGTLLTTVAAGLPAGMIAHSLFSAKCQHDFSCAAFAISSGAPTATLPQLQIRFKLSAAQDAALNSWIVVAEQDPCLTVFVEGGPEGSIAVPATEEKILSVAGLRPSGQIWEGSSRGPSAEYDITRNPSGSPHMAHLADLGGGSFATSFASPRACADVVATLASSSKRAKCTNVSSLLSETYGLGTLPKWNSRFGYHKQTS